MDLARTAASNCVTVSWPGDVGYFELLQTTNVDPGNWTALTNPPVYMNDRWQVSLPANPSTAFYRLRAP